MERIAIVADLHANIYALNVFLEYITKNNIEEVINLGDFLQIGPNPLEIIKIVLNDKRFVNILGNNEMSLINRNLENFDELEIKHQEWVIKQIGAEHINLLKQIPTEKYLSIANKSFLAIHARKNSIIELPLLYSGSSIEEFVTDYGENTDFVLIGHTHLQGFVTYWKGKPILNPGSLGCGKEGLAKFAVISLSEEEISLTFMQLKYDKNQVIKDLNGYNVPDKERIIDIFY